MNKAELVTAISDKTAFPKKDVEKAVNAIIDSLEEALAGGDKVTLVGFGTFGVKSKAARKGRNPQTGAEISIPAGKVPSFKAGKDLKEMVK